MEPKEMLEKLSKLGIPTTMKTLQNYVAQGLITMPERSSIGRGKGKVTAYKDDAHAEFYASYNLIHEEGLTAKIVNSIRQGAIRYENDGEDLFKACEELSRRGFYTGGEQDIDLRAKDVILRWLHSKEKAWNCCTDKPGFLMLTLKDDGDLEKYFECGGGSSMDTLLVVGKGRFFILLLRDKAVPDNLEHELELEKKRIERVFNKPFIE